MKLKEHYLLMKASLLKAGIEEAGFEAKQLIKRVLGIDDAELLLNRLELSGEQQETLSELCRKRCGGYPLQYLLGDWEFYGLPFLVGEGVLIPRQDTETLCEWVVSRFSDRQGMKILDLCSGSGCIAVTLEHYLPGSTVWALEKSKTAARYCEKNIALNQSSVRLVLDDALDPAFAETGFDLIVSNPPYLSEEDMGRLQKEVSFEPREALEAGKDGLAFYRELTRIWTPRLKAGGILAYEVGIHQKEDVCSLLEAGGLDGIGTRRDLCGVERVVYGMKPCEENKEEIKWQ